MLFMLEDTLDNITIPIALEHTGIAMGVVFGVLIVISGLIYLLKFVPEYPSSTYSSYMLIFLSLA